MSKRIFAIFSVLAMFSIAAVAQDAPKNTVKKQPAKQTTKKIVPRKVVKTKAVKANVPAAKMHQ